MKCPHCEREISIKNESCPHCKGELYKIVVTHTSTERTEYFRPNLNKYRLDPAIAIPLLAVLAPFILRLLQNYNIIFIDSISSVVVSIILVASDYVLIPWTIASLLIQLTKGFVFCIKKRYRPEIQELLCPMAVVILSLIYTVYSQSIAIIPITALSCGVKLLFSRRY